MDRNVVFISSFEEADDHVTFYNDKTPLEKLNYACFIINSIFNVTPLEKVHRNITFARKHVK
ncbi:MAG: hypothetical protein I4O51_12145 [Flavobacterium micromati]|nr:hypothetical protein [Flavobacterium micromati]